MRVEHIGDATLILSDCMDIMRDMPDKAFELAIVDPPYGDGGGELGKQEAEQIRRMVRQYSIGKSTTHTADGSSVMPPPDKNGRNMVEEIPDRRGLP